MHFNHSFAWCNNLSCLKKSLCNLFTEKYFLFILQHLRKNATETQGSAAACHTSFIWCVCWLQTDLNYVNSCSPCSHCLYLSSRKQVSGADLVRDAPHPIRQGWGDCGWVPIQTMHPPPTHFHSICTEDKCLQLPGRLKKLFVFYIHTLNAVTAYLFTWQIYFLNLTLCHYIDCYILLGHIVACI